MHLKMAFRSISCTLPTPVLTFGLGSTRSVRHCAPPRQEIGQKRQTFGISGGKNVAEYKDEVGHSAVEIQAERP